MGATPLGFLDCSSGGRIPRFITEVIELTSLVLVGVILLTGSTLVATAQEVSPTPTPQDFPCSFFTFYFGGLVYDAADGVAHPIVGASIEATVTVTSGGCYPGVHHATSGEDGRYAFGIASHDTNPVFLRVQAEGYSDYQAHIGALLWLGQNEDVPMPRAPTPTPTFVNPGSDINRDRRVDFLDILLLILDWKRSAGLGLSSRLDVGIMGPTRTPIPTVVPH
ncbi:MAG: hypothetical protein GHCLOJNM_00787 [bacterium]|nr:hypothetical protein [bacterium]